LRITGEAAVVIEVAARSIGGLCSQVLRLDCDDAPGVERSLEEVILRQACDLPLGAISLVDDACGVLMVPTPAAGILRGVSGVDSASKVPGITGVTIAVPFGERVVPLPEGDRYLGFVFARGASPGAVERSLREADALLVPDIA
jgi:hypothetical protein